MKQASDQQTAATEQAPTILLVDDNAEVLELLTTFLGEEFCCVTARNVPEALAWLAEHSCALVLTDLEMPGASGFDLCRHVKQHWPETIVLVLSGQHLSACASEARRLGALDYLTKPVDLSWLLRRIRQALA